MIREENKEYYEKGGNFAMKKMSGSMVLNIVGNVLILAGTAITTVITGRKSTKEIIETVAKVRGTTK